LTSVLTVPNLVSVKNDGEVDVWVALIKGVAIVVFLAIGGAAIVGLLPGSNVSGAARLVNARGFMPNCVGAELAAMLTTMFS
ncbi:GABA permease, partial [Burkholderia pseudomallei]